ncbi:hypothetical protein K461DRAFT_281266 [Myriangium duriaei CBS 260.36]|uniref:Uncharacterized protein n=1 Tax=Myriangium duriaei CBS 260.36 TaxID=1168546 RepID=A0A9P4IYF6_9PEZI|nr:hypothetical protein K461DRAFT_281266 [Myriangium duriaei CBS 260.36]
MHQYFFFFFSFFFFFCFFCFCFTTGAGDRERHAPLLFHALPNNRQNGLQPSTTMYSIPHDYSPPVSPEAVHRRMGPWNFHHRNLP